MLVGWGGNNGSTLTAGILANKKKLSYKTWQGKKESNFFGSLTQSVTTWIGVNYNRETKQIKDVHRTIKDIVPLVDTENILITGWDISSSNLYESCERA